MARELRKRREPIDPVKARQEFFRPMVSRYQALENLYHDSVEQAKQVQSLDHKVKELHEMVNIFDSINK